MSKRVSTTQLTHDNWDQEVEKEDPGTFSAASEQELQTRVIKKAKRTLNTSTDSSGNTTSASPFRAFTGFANRSLSAQPNFSFLPQSANTESPASSTLDQTNQNGRSKSPDQAMHSLPISTAQTGSSVPSESPVSLSKNQDDIYFSRLQNLNESVMKWMTMHFEKNPYCNFSPVFNDYKNYAQQLEVKYLSKSGKVTNSQQSSESVISNSSFKTPNTSEWMRTAQSKSDFFKSSPAKESQKTDHDPKSEPEMLYGAGFASNTTNTSTVSYGRAKYPTETSGSQSKTTPKTTEKSDVTKGDQNAEVANKPLPFGFGGGSSNLFDAKSVVGNSDKKLFTMQFTPSAVASNVDTTDSAIKDDDDYVPPCNDVIRVTEVDALYSKRCKLFCQKNNEYVDRGVGTLYLKPINGKTQLLIRADTNLGNVLLNIMLSASLPMKRVGKNNVLIVCVPNPPFGESGDGDAKDAVPLLVRVKTSKDADELLEIMNKHKS